MSPAGIWDFWGEKRSNNRKKQIYDCWMYLVNGRSQWQGWWQFRWNGIMCCFSTFILKLSTGQQSTHFSDWAWYSCLFEQNLDGWGVSWTNCRWGGYSGCRVQGGQQRLVPESERKGHFFWVSHCGERLGFFPAGLTAISRNVWDWRPGWGRALSCSLCETRTGAKRCERPRALWRGILTL